MKRFLLFLFAATLTWAGSLHAQCIASTQYPSGTVTSTNTGSAQNITTCNYGGEYSVLTGFLATGTYNFGSSISTDYLTLTTTANVVIAQGVTPLTGVALATGTTYRLHVHTNSTCGTANACRTTTITYVPPPCTGTPNAGSIATATQSTCTGSLPGAIAVTGTSAGAGITYQWQESTNSGSSWASAVGGSGATTTSYTPPALGSTTIMYRLMTTCSNSAQTNVSNAKTITPFTAAPTTQATNLVFTWNSAGTGGTFTWTNGNGNSRFVIISNAPITDPGTNETPGTASTTYAGSGQQYVFSGTGTSVTVTGLSCSNTYYAKVYERFNCTTSLNNTSAGATNNPLTVNPISTPTTQAAISTFTVNATFGTTLNLTAGNGGNRVVYINTVNSFTDPSGALPTASLAYSGSGQQAVYIGTGTSTGAITGLGCGGTTYFARVYEYSVCSGTNNYNVSGSAVSFALPSATIPYAQDFEGVTTNGAMPSGWSVANTSFSGVNYAGAAHGNSSKGATFNLYSSLTTNNMRTQKITAVPTLCQLSFKSRVLNYSSYPNGGAPVAGYGNIKVQISTNCGGNWTDLMTMGDELLGTAFVTKNINLAAYAGQDVVIRWNGTWATGDWFFDLDDVTVNPGFTFYQDSDADGFGNAAVSQVVYAASLPTVAGYVTNSTDCNDSAVTYVDSDGDTYGAGSAVACGNSTTNTDCDDADVLEFPGQTWYIDADGDQYGSTSTTSCTRPANGFVAAELVATTTDCNDGAFDINPAATEKCDEGDVDEDCDGASDDTEVGDDATGQVNYYADNDSDGFGAGAAMNMCNQPAGSQTNNTDCDDLRADVSPADPELCDLNDIDEDCDGASDDNEVGDNALGQLNYYADVDNDGFGAGAVMVMCNQPAGSVLNNNTDCQPTLPLSFPGAVENLCDGIDNNCNGQINELPAGTTCAPVNGLSHSNVTKTQARINWVAQCGILYNRVQYRKANTNSWIYRNTNAPGVSTLVYNLTPATQYLYRARNYCNGNIAGSLSAELSFTTLAALEGPEMGNDAEGIEVAQRGIVTSDVKMYPNPTRGFVELQLTNLADQTVQIALLDPMGKTSMNWAVGTQNGEMRTTFNVSDLPTGVYIVRVQTQEGAVLRTLVKE